MTVFLWHKSYTTEPLQHLNFVLCLWHGMNIGISMFYATIIENQRMQSTNQYTE